MFNKLFKSKLFFQTIIVSMAAIFATIGLVAVATTIGANISTGGTLSITGTTATSTFSTGGLTIGTNQFVVQQSSGYLGIGTSSPSEQLEITGNLKLPTTTATAGIIKIGATPFIHGYGTDNTFVGPSAGNFTMTGTGVNTFIGANAGMANTTGYHNTFIGYAGIANTTGYRNTFVGVGAGIKNTEGYSNVFVGRSAGNQNTTGTNNTAVGENSLVYNTTGINNVALGRHTIEYSVTGNYNTAIGYEAGFGSTGNSYTGNTLIGYTAGFNLSTGGYNMLAGYGAGDNLTTGSENIIIGFNIDAPAVNSFQTLNIGNLIYATGLDGEGTTLSSGSVGIGTITPFAKLSVTGTTAQTNPLFVVDYSADGTATSSAMYINSSGNVGIGTTTPAATLDIEGYMRLKKNTSQPVACSAGNAGAIALNSSYLGCVCNGTSWINIASSTENCVW